LKMSINLPDWPRAVTKCHYCAGDIIYYVYKDAEQTERKPVPRYHPGHCQAMAALGLAGKKIEQQKKRKTKQEELF